MPSKLRITNHGPQGRELLVVLTNNRRRPLLSALVSRHVLCRHQIHEVVLQPHHALIVRPLRRGSHECGDAAAEHLDVEMVALRNRLNKGNAK